MTGRGQDAESFDVVLLGASRGGLKAMGSILGALPADFGAAIAAVIHRSPNGPGWMAEILDGRTPLMVKDAEEGDKLAPGTVYIAPTDRHLLINGDGSLSLADSRKVHFSRPAVDLLFQSGARSLGGRVIAVVLTGGEKDGADGARAVKEQGGLVIAQDRATSENFDMPRAAIATGAVDQVLPLDHIPGVLLSLTRKP